jgi:uncharacterized phage infection (PIP) family protein YhgE
MGEITAASQEQTSGIEQINMAIAQMDEVTQQNAALVEEAAAAAQSMQNQAGNLSQVVSVFRISGQSHALRAPAKSNKPAAPAAKAPAAPAAPAKPRSVPAPQPSPERKLALMKSTGNEDWEEF